MGLYETSNYGSRDIIYETSRVSSCFSRNDLRLVGSTCTELIETDSSSRTAVLNTCFPMHLFTLYMLSCMCHELNQLSLVEMIQFSSDTAGVTKSTTAVWQRWHSIRHPIRHVSSRWGGLQRTTCSGQYCLHICLRQSSRPRRRVSPAIAIQSRNCTASAAVAQASGV